MNLSYDVSTLTSEGSIEQRVFEDFNGVRTRLFTTVVNTREEQIRQALITLGWRPPDALPRADRFADATEPYKAAIRTLLESYDKGDPQALGDALAQLQALL